MTHNQKLLARTTLSGILSYAAIPVLDKALDWIGVSLDLGRLLPGLVFGLLVMAPAVPRGARRILAIALSVLIYYGAVELAVYEAVTLRWRELIACGLSGFIGAVAVGVASAFLLPAEVPPRRLLTAAIAGALSGTLFGLNGTFRLSGVIEAATLILGFIAWQTGTAFILLRPKENRPNGSV